MLHRPEKDTLLLATDESGLQQRSGSSAGAGSSEESLHQRGLVPDLEEECADLVPST